MTNYLTTSEAAEKLRLSPQALRVWRLRGVGPKFVKPSRSRCLYAESDLEDYMRERTFSSTTEETVRRDSSAAA